MATPTRIVCVFALVVTTALLWTLAPQAQASAQPVSQADGIASSVAPMAFLGIGDENEPDENDDEPDEDSPAPAKSQKGSAIPLPALLLLAALGLVVLRLAAKRRQRLRRRGASWSVRR